MGIGASEGARHRANSQQELNTRRCRGQRFREGLRYRVQITCEKGFVFQSFLVRSFDTVLYLIDTFEYAPASYTTAGSRKRRRNGRAVAREGG